MKSTSAEVDPTRPAEVTLLVQNLSTVVQAADLRLAFPVFLKQVNYDLHLDWHEPETYVPYLRRIRELRAGKPWPGEPDAWRASIYDYPQQTLTDRGARSMPVEALGDVGYHYLDDGVPHIIVFAAVAQQGGIPWTLTFSHELLESLADPQVSTTTGGDKYELEICDPVQYHAYPIDGTWVSNFVTPKWFDDPPTTIPTTAPRERYDFADQLVAPRQRALGGERTLKLRGQDRTEVLTPFGPVVAP